MQGYSMHEAEGKNGLKVDDIVNMTTLLQRLLGKARRLDAALRAKSALQGSTTSELVKEAGKPSAGPQLEDATDIAEENAALYAGLETVTSFTTMMMEAYRDQIRTLTDAKCMEFETKEAEMRAKDEEIEALQAQNRALLMKVMDMAEVMHEASDADEKLTLTNEAMIVKLATENDALRQLLKVKEEFGS